MKPQINYLLTIMILLATVLGCKKDLTSTNNNGPFSEPLAKAGADIFITLPTNSVTLSGAESYDPNGNIISYQWKKISGPVTFTIEKPNASITLLKDLVEGIYEFELTVTDNEGMTTSDRVLITVYGEGGCLLSIRPTLHVNLTEVGTLSKAGIPYVAYAGNKIVFAIPNTEDANKLDIYNVLTDQWEHVSMPINRIDMGVASAGTKIFFAGGRVEDLESDVVNIYDLQDGTWSFGHLKEARFLPVAVSTGTKVLFAGGITDGGFGQSGTMDIYDMISKQWTSTSMPVTRFGMAAVAIEDDIYFAGGVDISGGLTKSIYIFKTTSNSWSTSMLDQISGAVSGAFIGNKLYWAGMNMDKNVGRVEINDFSTIESQIECLCYGRYAPQILARNDEVIITTPGQEEWVQHNEYGNKIDIYNSTTGKWSIGQLDFSITDAAFIVVNNTIYMAGGKLNNGQYSNKVYKLTW